MAKVVVTGIRRVSFTDDNKREVKGTSVFYRVKLEPHDDLHASGYFTDKVWINDGTDLEKHMLGANYDKPFEADLLYDIIPGRKRPVLIDIRF